MSDFNLPRLFPPAGGSGGVLVEWDNEYKEENIYQHHFSNCFSRGFLCRYNSFFGKDSAWDSSSFWLGRGKL